MKYSDKIFLLVAVVVLGLSLGYYYKSQPELKSFVAKNEAQLNEQAAGIKWEAVPVPPFVQASTIEWPEVRAQDEDGKWFFQVFTPPQIWVDRDGKFITESPYYKEVARQQFAFSFGGVENEPYYIEYRGYFGSAKNPTIQILDTRTNSVLTGKLNEEIVVKKTLITKETNTGITLKSFDVKRVKSPNGMIDTQVTIALFDRALGKTVEIYSYKPTVLLDQRRFVLSASDGSKWFVKQKGDKITKNDVEYVAENVDFDKESVLIKMLPLKDKSDVRLMKVSSAGVEQQ